MTPLGRIALGLLLVLLDLRLPAFDVVPDVLGWVLVVAGLGELVSRCRGLAAARTAAVIAGVLSLADLVHPVRQTDGGGAEAVAPEGLLGLLSFGSTVASVVVAVLLSLRLRDLAAAGGDAPRARTFARFASYHAVVGGTAALIGFASLATSTGRTELQGTAAAVLLVVVLVVLAVEIAFVLCLRGARLEPWAQRDDVAPGTPNHDAASR